MKLQLSIVGLTAVLLVACTQQAKTPTPTSSDISSSAMSSSVQTSSKTPVAMMHQESSIQTSSVWNLNDALASMPTTKEAWLQIMTPDAYDVLWNEGTERPFTSPLLNEHRKGTFVTADCGEPVFRSEQKYDSGTGWPSFWAPISPDAVVEKRDDSLGITRVEIQSKCGGHLGHVFEDGPQPTGFRYCMNGVALRFIPDAVQ